MGLALYKEDNAGSLIDSANYLWSAHDALNGSWNTLKLWLRNDDATVYFENIEIEVNIPGVFSPNVSPNGIVYQLFPGDIEPTVLEWSRLPYHNTISMSDLGAFGSPDTSTYLPFWVRIYQPGNSSVGDVSDASLRVTAIERAV